jgi:hypothetical protein
VAWPLSYGLNGEEQAMQEISRWLERYVAREVYRVLISRLLLPCALRHTLACDDLGPSEPGSSCTAYGYM